MLDAFAFVLAQILFDLADLLRLFFVQGYSNEPIGCGQGAGDQTGVLALDVKEADLAKVEEPLVILGPVVHSTLVHVVSQVVDDVEAASHGMAVNAFEVLKVNVVDGPTVFKAIDEVNDCTANGPDGRQAEFAEARRDFNRLGAFLHRQRECLGRVRTRNPIAQAEGPCSRA